MDPIQIVENTNEVSREYRGVQFQTNWRPRRFNVGLNYTYATLKGNAFEVKGCWIVFCKDLNFTRVK